uniref:Berberine bridge enzyme-like 15 n=1 Tax=Elaeis guineensis var. tenera TaxID=51953 RepID=A0A8N4ESP3_ELAGV|nr:berberine bridge enzyme-like 15 [Elaeis guineensis]
MAKNSPIALAQNAKALSTQESACFWGPSSPAFTSNRDNSTACLLDCEIPQRQTASLQMEALGELEFRKVRKTLGKGATKLVERWQEVAPKFDDNLFIRILVNPIGKKEQGNRTIQASFESLFLGGREELLSILDKSFPELGVPYANSTFKIKSDFMKEPIPAEGLKKIWKFLLEAVDDPLLMILDPLKGRMDELEETALPFPRRKGNLYNIQHHLNWPGNEDSQKHLDWMKNLYDFMAP